MLKKTLTAVAIATLAFTAQAADVLKVAATAVPHAEILNFIKPQLKAAGIELQVKEFSDYVQPNAAVQDKQLDANFFQHQPYLDSYNKDRQEQPGAPCPMARSTSSPLAPTPAKSKTWPNSKTAPPIAIPNDPSNGGRALILLAKQGLIELKDPSQPDPHPAGRCQKPEKAEIQRAGSPLLPRALADVDLALINTNYAIEAKLNPTKDALFIEGADSPYTNIVAARKDRADGADIAKLMKALHQPRDQKVHHGQVQGCCRSSLLIRHCQRAA